MKNKIKEIKEIVHQIAKLPDGYYYGIWGGYHIELKHNKKTYSIETEVGVRGTGIKVIIEVKDNVASFEELTV